MQRPSWRPVALLLLSGLACGKGSHPIAQSAPTQQVGAEGKTRGAGASVSGAPRSAGSERDERTQVDKQVRPESDRDLTGATGLSATERFVLILGQALIQYREVLDFSNAVGAASLALSC